MKYPILLTTFILLLFITSACTKIKRPPEIYPPSVSPVSLQITESEQELLTKEPPYPQSEYIIGDGDVLDISVWEVPELCKTIAIRPDGKTSFPLVGELNVSGLTVAQFTEELAKKLEFYVKEPKVSVNINEISGKKVTIIGQVNKPGIYTFTENTTLLEVIGLAGGLSDNASFDDIVVKKNDGRNATINLNKLLVQADLSLNYWIENGDTIYFPEAQKVFILGQVKIPGAHKMGRKGISVLEAVTEAGGFTDDATLSGVKVVRAGAGGKPELYSINLKRALKGSPEDNPQLQSGDIVYIPKSMIANAEKFVNRLYSAVSLLRLGQSFLFEFDFKRYAKEGADLSVAAQKLDEERSRRDQTRFEWEQEKFEKWLEEQEAEE